MHSFQTEDDYYVTHSMTAHSESLGQVSARKFPYDYSYDTYVLGNDKLVPHPPLKEKKKLLRRTKSNPEGASVPHTEGSQMNHLPALKDKKALLRMGKTDQATALQGMTGTRPNNELSVLTAKMNKIPEKVAESTENFCCKNPLDVRNAHKKLERSKTTPVSFLKPLLKTNHMDTRRRVQLSAMNPRGYSLDGDQHGSCRTQNITSNSCRIPSENEGRIYGTTDAESHGLFKELEKTYGSPPMTRALPNGRRFGPGRMEDRYREEQQTNTVVSATTTATITASPKIRTNNGVKEKRVQSQGKFTRTGQLTAGLQFIDGYEDDTQVSYESKEKNPEDSQALTYLRFTKERQEDNRI